MTGASSAVEIDIDEVAIESRSFGSSPGAEITFTPATFTPGAMSCPGVPNVSPWPALVQPCEGHLLRMLKHRLRHSGSLP